MGKVFIFLLLLIAVPALSQRRDTILSYTPDLLRQHVKMYWRAENGMNFGSLKNLRDWLQHNGIKLVMAMNAGMYTSDKRPKGLYIENGKIVTPLDMGAGNGNFYLKPNGIFFITRANKAGICSSNVFRKQDILFATQSGPLLLINGNIHPSFTSGSHNVNIRNGVGILPNGNPIFAISIKPVNLYDFALYFKQLGCSVALYLDGFISRAYIPTVHAEQLDGDFGVIIAVTE